MRLISVIIPVYNSEKYIAQCLDSILNNTYKNIEVVCIDDGSKDHSAQIITRYQADHPNIILIRQENAGVSAARNAGLKIAKGEYISFIDSDDEIASIYFESMLNAIESANTDMAACSYSTDQLQEDQFSGEYKVFADGEYYKQKQLKTYVTFKLFKKELIEGIQFAERIDLAEDIAFNYEVLTRKLNSNSSISCTFTKDRMYYYRPVESSLTHSVKAERWLPLCNWLENKAKEETNITAQSLLRYEALKKWLTVYYTLVQASDREKTNTVKKRLKSLRRKIHFVPEYMIRKQFRGIMLFSRFPRLYVLFRNRFRI